MLARFVRHRLVVFALLGGGLYALSLARAERRVVAIDPAALSAVREAQARKLGVGDLGEVGRREVDARAIEDEVLYREALRLGLDRDDPVVRQRLVQKLLLLVEDLGGAGREPSREELVAYFEANRERWRRPARYALVHVFAGRAVDLPSGSVLDGATEAPAAGDAFPYARKMNASRDDIARLLGSSFADAVVALPPGTVSEPIASSFGWHRVRLVAREPGAPARFDEVQKDVLIDYLLQRREEVVGTYLRTTTASYEIRVGDDVVRDFTPTRRVAARTQASAED
ncbi:MAG: peptidylprolyl isomerase [Labilithrix sp.]